MKTERPGWRLRDQPKERRYRVLSTRMYLDARVRAMDVLGKLVWQYLLCNHHTTAIPGLSVLHETTAAADLGISLEDFRHGFKQVADGGMAEADWKAGLVWVRKAWLYEPPTTPNQLIQWRTLLQYELPECVLLRRAVAGIIAGLRAAYEFPQGFENAVVEHLPEPFREPFPEPFRQPSPEPGSRIQDPISTTARAHAPARDDPQGEGVGDSVVQESPTSPPPQEPTEETHGSVEPPETVRADPPSEAVAARSEAIADEGGRVLPFPAQPAHGPRERLWTRLQKQREAERGQVPEPIDRVVDKATGVDTLEELRILYGDELVATMHLAYLRTDRITMAGRGTIQLSRAKPGWAWDLFKRNADRYFTPAGQAPPTPQTVVGEVRNAF